MMASLPCKCLLMIDIYFLMFLLCIFPMKLYFLLSMLSLRKFFVHLLIVKPVMSESCCERTVDVQLALDVCFGGRLLWVVRNMEGPM